MTSFSAHVTGLDSTALRLREMPEAVRQSIHAAVMRQALLLETYVKEEKLSGQVLKAGAFPHGRLRQSIHTEVVSDDAHGTTAKVGTDVEYAARHEYGFSGTEQVREHLALITQAFGRALPTPVWATIRAHSRKVDYPAHSYLRSGAEDRRLDILADIAIATQGTLGQ